MRQFNHNSQQQYAPAADAGAEVTCCKLDNNELFTTSLKNKKTSCNQSAVML